MEYYAEDAALVGKPGMTVKGKENIRSAFITISDYFQAS
jgi:ketosteroid isomerase-like protein